MVLGIALLAVTLIGALLRPRGLPEVTFALPCAAVTLLAGLCTPAAAWEEVHRLAPVAGFLVAALLLARLCEAEGVFDHLGALLARRAGHDGRALLLGVTIIGALVTAVLSLDATVVLLTPIVLSTTRLAKLPPRAHLYLCAHLANSASLLLPVSNLTNLLALGDSGLNFLTFTALMAGPWLVVLIVEWALFRARYRGELGPASGSVEIESRPAPRFALTVLGLTLVGFAVGSLVGVEPVWIALAAVVVLTARGLIGGAIGLRDLGRAANLPFAVFVLALAVVVRGVVDAGLGDLFARLLPGGDSLLVLLMLAGIAALLSNLVNNLPAVLLLLPLVADQGALAVLAVLIGVNLGPNLSYPGSLATLLWRRVLLARGFRPSLAEFTRLGLLTTPITVLAAVLALWTTASLTGIGR